MERMGNDASLEERSTSWKHTISTSQSNVVGFWCNPKNPQKAALFTDQLEGFRFPGNVLINGHGPWMCLTYLRRTTSILSPINFDKHPSTRYLNLHHQSSPPQLSSSFHPQQRPFSLLNWNLSMMNLERGGEFSFFNIQEIAKKAQRHPLAAEWGRFFNHICMWVCMCGCMCVCMTAYVWDCMCVCMCVYVCVCVCVLHTCDNLLNRKPEDWKPDADAEAFLSSPFLQHLDFLRWKWISRVSTFIKKRTTTFCLGKRSLNSENTVVSTTYRYTCSTAIFRTSEDQFGVAPPIMSTHLAHEVRKCCQESFTWICSKFMSPARCFIRFCRHVLAWWRLFLAFV